MAVIGPPFGSRSYQSWNLIDATPDVFDLDAGLYGITALATVWGTASLQRQLPDGVGGYVYVLVATALAANGYATVWLPAGKYRLLLAGITDLTGAIELIAPGRRT